MQQKKSIFNPINFIKNPQILDEYQCIICMQKQILTLRCKSCKKSICNQCSMDQITKLSGTCPLRCKPQQFLLEKIPQLNIKYYCQYSNKCQCILNSTKQFIQHDRKCQYISNQQKIQQKKKWEFKCKNNHTLQIAIGFYANLIKRKLCCQCRQENPIRAICRKCDEGFCMNCRPFPIYNMKCPLEHLFTKKSAKTLNYRCDICELSPKIHEVDVYDDINCNLGICEMCFKNVPKFEKEVHCIENLNNYCDLIGNRQKMQKMGEEQKYKYMKEHQLNVLPEQVIERCQWCQKQKNCYKHCTKCKKYYCITCKMFNIFDNRVCQYGHRMQQLTEKQINSRNKKKQKTFTKCVRCNNNYYNIMTYKLPMFYVDNQCKVVFCEECVDFLFSYTVDTYFKNMSAEITHCKQEHLLFFLGHIVTQKLTCDMCNGNKITKLTCGFCQQRKNYCCKCIPPKHHQICYCSKNLVVVKDCKYNNCLVCERAFNNGTVYGCVFCCYAICEKCYNYGFQCKK